MTRLDLLNRVITAAGLVTLAVTLGVWLSRPPLTAAPPSAPAKAAREPTPAPPPIPSGPPRTATTEVQIEVEIAPPASAAADSSVTGPAPRAVKPAWPKCEPQPRRQSRRRGLFRRR